MLRIKGGTDCLTSFPQQLVADAARGYVGTKTAGRLKCHALSVRVDAADLGAPLRKGREGRGSWFLGISRLHAHVGLR